MLDSSRLALQAHRLSGSDRESFVREHCGEDPAKIAELAAKLAELDELCATLPSGAADSDPDVTVDPEQSSLFQTTPPTSEHSDDYSLDSIFDQTSDCRLGQGSDPDAGHPTMDGELALDPHRNLSHQERLKAEAILDRFKSDCSGEHTPDWYSYLPPDCDDQLKRYLAHHLVLLDLDHRDQRKLPIDSNAYASRMPDCRREILAAITMRDRGTKTPVIRRSRSASESTPADLDWVPRSETSASMRYLPGKLHAKGGLGAVYRGRDTELGRTVALKRILPKYENNAECRDRFVFEAEVTGSLEHPGIVPIYGLSTYEDGRPYYAMRFIRGSSFRDAINEFHREHDPPTAGSFDSRAFRSLLRKLIDSCNAMHYAHERGILHRDLKPDNIMLGSYGETLVVDWGLAMVMRKNDTGIDRSKAAEDTLPVQSKGSQTGEGTTVGTPCYMSPEQANGVHDRLTPATDIYALGAILFRIASNQMCVDGKTMLDVVVNVRDGNVRDLNKTVPAAPRAIASICRRAMARSPSDRYGTAVELADDLERWMNDEPVTAHADAETVGEKAGRMIRRYRSWTLSAAVSLITVAIIAIVASFLIQRAKAKEEVAKVRAELFKEEAIARYRQSREAIDTWLVQSTDALQYFPGTRSVRSRLLTLAADDYAKLADGISNDPELELERLRAMIRQGDLLQAGEKPAEAREVYADAIAVLDQPRGEDATPRFVAEQAHVRSRIGLSWAAEGQIESARESYAAAIDTLRRLLKDEGSRDERDVDGWQRYLAAAEINAGELELQANEFDRSRQSLQSGIETLGRLGERRRPKDHLTRSRAMELLGRLQSSLGDTTAAADQFKAAAEIIYALKRDEPDQPEYLAALGSLMVSRAAIDLKLGQSDREERALREAVDAFRSLQRAIPDMPAYQENLALTLTDLGIALHDHHRSDEARPVLEESLERLGSLTRDYGESNRYADTTAATQDVLGQVLLDLGETPAAQTHWIQSLTAYQSLSETYPDRPDYHERLAIVQSHLSQAVMTVSPADAVAGFDGATSTLRELVDVFPDVPSYRSSLAHVAFERGKFLASEDVDAGRTSLESAVEQWTHLADQNDAASCERLAWLLVTSPIDAMRDETRACELASKAVGLVPQNEVFRSTLALAQVAAKKLDQASRTILPLTDDVPASDLSGRGWWAIAVVRRSQGQTDAADLAEAAAETWYALHSPRQEELAVWRKWAGAAAE